MNDIMQTLLQKFSPNGSQPLRDYATITLGEYAELLEFIKDVKRAKFQEIEELNLLYMAAKNVIDWTERAYRPPVLDEFETGRMVKVRLHALSDLNDAIESIKAKNT
jgi:hypothetical protein